MIEILHEDCMAVMARMEDNSVDLVVTSPPYNLNKKASGGGSSNRTYNGWYADDMPELEYQRWQKAAVAEMLRVCRGSVLYNHRIRFAWHSRNTYRTPSNVYHPFSWLSGFPIWEEIIWHRMATSGHANGRCRLADERIYHIGKPITSNDMGYTSVWSIPPSKNVGHVCTFPEELVERCLLAYSKEGDIIFDPFMGIGTTGKVCKALNRDFVGCELDEDYYSAAKARFEQETRQEALF